VLIKKKVSITFCHALIIKIYKNTSLYAIIGDNNKAIGSPF